MVAVTVLGVMTCSWRWGYCRQLRGGYRNGGVGVGGTMVSSIGRS